MVKAGRNYEASENQGPLSVTTLALPSVNGEIGDATASGISPVSSSNASSQTLKQRSGPSSRRTVLTIAGLLIVGLLLISTGIIVLSNETQTEFVVTASLFLALGCLFLIICFFLQRKNLVKYVSELEEDLYFLNAVTDNYVWRLISDDIDTSTADKKPRNI